MRRHIKLALDKYFSQVTIVEHKDGSKEAVETEQILAKDTKPKFICCWTEGKCDKWKDGFCTHQKYCNQKGEVSKSE